jgi:hypothetical protein
MLYCLAVKEDSVNRPRRGVEWRGLGRTMWASEERTAPFFFSPIGDHTFCDTLPHLSRNSRSFNTRPSSPTSASEFCQMSRGSAVYRSRPGTDSFEEWQGLRRPSHEPASNRTTSKENTAWLFLHQT